MKPNLVNLLVACLLLLAATGSNHATETATGSSFALDSLLMMPVSSVAKYKQKQTEAPAYISIITRADIQTYGYRTMEEVLRAQVGFYSSDDREYPEVGIRGIGRPGHYNNKVLVLLDGHATNDSFSGGVRLGTAFGIDLDTIERIEIVRGPGSALYGARAMLAVINVVTRKGRDIDRIEVQGHAGNLGSKGASVILGRVLGPDEDFALSASWATTDGEDIYFEELDSPIQNYGIAEGRNWRRLFRGLLTYRKGNFFLQGVASRRYQGIPTGSHSSLFNHPDAESMDEVMMLETRYSKGFGPNLELTGRLYGDSYSNEGVYPFAVLNDDGTQAIATLEPQAGATSYGVETRLRWDPSAKQRLVFGVEYLHVFAAHFHAMMSDVEVLDGDHPYRIVSGFIHEEFQLLKDLALTVGVRRDQYSTRGSSTTPRMALVYHPNASSTFKLMAGEAFRAPNLIEMHIDLALNTLSNPDLEPEKIRSYELVWEQRISRVAATLSLFQNEVRDLIDLVELYIPDPEGGPGRIGFQRANIGEAYSRGLELEVRGSLPGGLHTRAGYGLHLSRDERTGNRLVNSPRHMVRINASRDFAGWVTMGLNVRRESSRLTLYQTKTDAATLVDATISSGSRFGPWKAQLIIKNTGDLDCRLPGSSQHVQSAIPQPGRNLVLRLGYTW